MRVTVLFAVLGSSLVSSGLLGATAAAAAPLHLATLTVANVAPTAGQTVSGSIVWKAAATGATRVDFKIDGVVKWNEFTAPYVYNGDTGFLNTKTLTNGTHTLTVTAVGGGLSKSSSITVKVANNVVAPLAIATSSPLAGTVSGKIPWQASITSGTAARVSFLVDGVAQWNQASAPYTFNGSGGTLDTTTLPNGSHQLSAVAYSSSGTSVTSTVAVSVSNAAPPPPVAANLGTSLPARLPQSSGVGGTFYVDGAAGSDSNNGSAAAPWKTINKALASVPAAGSIINVLPGTYYSQGTNYAITFTRQASTADPITLRAQTPGTVVIANADPNTWTLGGWIYGASGLRIQGLVFRIDSTPNLNLGTNALLIENSDRIELANSTINQVGTVGLMVRGGYNDGQTSDDVWFIDNVFRTSTTNVFAQVTGLGYDTSQYFGSKGSHWIYAGQYGNGSNWDIQNGSRRLVVTNNVFTGTTAGRDIELGPQAQQSYVVNNTFFGNHPLSLIGTSTLAAYAGQGVELFTNSTIPAYQTSGNVIANNLFADLEGHAVYGSGPNQSGNVVASNLSYGLGNGLGYQDRTSMDYEPNYQGTQTLFTVGVNLPDANPQFLNPTGFDFHLASASPARGGANPAYSYPFDADGNARPAAPAVGAFG